MKVEIKDIKALLPKEAKIRFQGRELRSHSESVSLFVPTAYIKQFSENMNVVLWGETFLWKTWGFSVEGGKLSQKWTVIPTEGKGSIFPAVYERLKTEFACAAKALAFDRGYDEMEIEG